MLVGMVGQAQMDSNTCSSHGSLGQQQYICLVIDLLVWGVFFQSSVFHCVDTFMYADAVAFILTLSNIHLFGCIVHFLCLLLCWGLISYMLYVQQQYFLHAHNSMSDVLAVASLGTCSATAAVYQIYSAKTKHINTAIYISMLIFPRVVMTETHYCWKWEILPLVQRFHP